MAEARAGPGTVTRTELGTVTEAGPRLPGQSVPDPQKSQVVSPITLRLGRHFFPGSRPARGQPTHRADSKRKLEQLEIFASVPRWPGRRQPSSIPRLYRAGGTCVQKRRGLAALRSDSPVLPSPHGWAPMATASSSQCLLHRALQLPTSARSPSTPARVPPSHPATVSHSLPISSSLIKPTSLISLSHIHHSVFSDT